MVEVGRGEAVSREVPGPQRHVRVGIDDDTVTRIDRVICPDHGVGIRLFHGARADLGLRCRKIVERPGSRNRRGIESRLEFLCAGDEEAVVESE